MITLKTHMIVMVIFLLGLGVGMAQKHTLDRFTISGGGNESSGGPYTVTGTIGQPVPGESSGSPYAIAGGFWGLFGSYQSPGAPGLLISYDSALDQLTVSWALPAEGWVLEENPTLGIENSLWQLIPPATYRSNATHRFVTMSRTTGTNFFRLRLP